MNQNLYIFWTGDNELSPNRKTNIELIRKNSQANVIFVTPKNLEEFVRKEHPLNPAYPYLCYTHRSDYLRCYFMHYYGGGYSDIKRIDYDWRPYFNQLQTSQLWAIGYAETSPINIAKGSFRYNELTRNYQNVMGLGKFIFKPNTPLTQAWLDQTEHTLNRYYRRLKRQPAKVPHDFRFRRARSGLARLVNRAGSKYPLEWSQILGDILHPLSYEHSEKIALVMPPAITTHYR